MKYNGPVGSCVAANSYVWKCGEPLYECLDAYNNGEYCYYCCDD